MSLSAWGCMLFAIGALLARAQNAQKVGKLRDQSEVEEIYVARSVLESRVAPTQFCAEAKSGFKSAIEDQYTFRATATRTFDGRMIDMNVRAIGNIHACFGPTSDPAVSNFYGEFVLGNLHLKELGGGSRADHPVKGLRSLSCSADLSGLPNRYVGGLLTTNSLTSLKALGLETDPPWLHTIVDGHNSTLEKTAGMLIWRVQKASIPPPEAAGNFG